MLKKFVYSVLYSLFWDGIQFLCFPVLQCENGTLFFSLIFVMEEVYSIFDKLKSLNKHTFMSSSQTLYFQFDVSFWCVIFRSIGYLINVLLHCSFYNLFSNTNHTCSVSRMKVYSFGQKWRISVPGIVIHNPKIIDF